MNSALVERLVTLGDSLPKSEQWNDYRAALMEAIKAITPPSGASDALHAISAVLRCVPVEYKDSAWHAAKDGMTLLYDLTSKAEGFPECSSTPNDCPENEGYGCCKATPPSPIAGSGQVEYDRELIADMLDGLISEINAWENAAIRQQIELLREADNRDAAGAHTAVVGSGSGMGDAIILKGVGKINGDGWKSTTKVGDVVFVWAEEMPEPHEPGQYLRVGNRCGWTASVRQYDFCAATIEEVRRLFEVLAAQPATNFGVGVDVSGDGVAVTVVHREGPLDTVIYSEIHPLPAQPAPVDDDDDSPCPKCLLSFTHDPACPYLGMKREQPAPVVGGDWVMVPRVPTHEQFEDGFKACEKQYGAEPLDDYAGKTNAIYAAMLSARPAVEGAQGARGGEATFVEGAREWFTTGYVNAATTHAHPATTSAQILHLAKKAADAIDFPTPPPATGSGGEVVAMFYIQDTRSYVGNCPLWWRPDGNGYTTRIDDAGKFTELWARRQEEKRDTDKAWPCEFIDSIQRPTIDMQDLRRMKEAHPAPARGE